MIRWVNWQIKKKAVYWMKITVFCIRFYWTLISVIDDMLTGTKSLSQPMLTEIRDAMWCLWATWMTRYQSSSQHGHQGDVYCVYYIIFIVQSCHMHVYSTHLKHRHYCHVFQCIFIVVLFPEPKTYIRRNFAQIFYGLQHNRIDFLVDVM